MRILLLTSESPVIKRLTVMWKKTLHKLVSLCFFLLRFNRLSVNSVDESSFAHLSNLQVLDIGTGNTDPHFKREETEGDKMMEEKQET